VALSYAARVFSNPESVLQRRQGSDYSVSFTDSSEGASSLTKAERDVLIRAAGRRHGSYRL
jgi:hypothetical protein